MGFYFLPGLVGSVTILSPEFKKTFAQRGAITRIIVGPSLVTLERNCEDGLAPIEVMPSCYRLPFNYCKDIVRGVWENAHFSRFPAPLTGLS
jgi:hypothetical protein